MISMKAMISQPMKGMSAEEIREVREKAKAVLEGAGYEVVDTYFTDEPEPDVVNRPLHFLAMSLAKMSECEAVYFCRGWDAARGCIIEHAAAKAYGLDVILE